MGSRIVRRELAQPPTLAILNLDEPWVYSFGSFGSCADKTSESPYLKKIVKIRNQHPIFHEISDINLLATMGIRYTIRYELRAPCVGGNLLPCRMWSYPPRQKKQVRNLPSRF